nr:TSUP family transporter [Nostocaceae cyanobacterium]
MHESFLTLPSMVFLFFTAMLAGMINSVAGGGGLIAFPALLLVGIPPINANATNTVGLWFGTAASAIAYRQELAHQKMLWLLSSVSVAGGVGGAYILLHTPEATFESLIHYLMLIGTVLFATGQP